MYEATAVQDHDSEMPIHLYWFRQDLRLTDNPALNHAAENGRVMAVYIVDDNCPMQPGAASNWWLQQSLEKLSKQLTKLGGKLYLFKGDPGKIIINLVTDLQIASVSWNRRYEPWQIRTDSLIKEQLIESNITVKTFNASLLFEPWEITKPDGSPYKVFTPYYKMSMTKTNTLSYPLSYESTVFYSEQLHSDKLIHIDEILTDEPWHNKLATHCEPGELAAKDRLSDFIQDRLNIYQEHRDYPDESATSMLSPHLHFGEISPRQVYYACTHSASTQNSDSFIRQLTWREFSYYQLYYHPDMDIRALRENFEQFPWQNNPELLARWQQGNTGIPVIDAGMRELWETGIMHNRVRMLVASFLVKNLGIHWHHGMAWFWDCLVDADLANNSCGWQWVTGCGIDSAPYFRIFNPVTQSRKFDPDGNYIRRYCPELSALSSKDIHAPWLASEQVLEEANLVIGCDYPAPIVDLKQSREIALNAYKHL